MYGFSYFLGAIVGTFLVSRLIWFVFTKWRNSLTKVTILSLVSAVVVTTLAAYGAADGGRPKFDEVAPFYLGSQVLITCFDFWRIQRSASAPTADPHAELTAAYNDFQAGQISSSQFADVADRSVAEQLRRKGHRLGIFVTVASLLLALVSFPAASGYGAPPIATGLLTLGLGGTLFGYLLARLWYWYKTA